MLLIRQVRRQSFTLVELLFVITIIGIIAGLAFPAMGNVMTKANLLKAVSNGKNICTAAQTSAFDANSTGSANYGWPADVGTFPSAHDYFILLTKNDYLKVTDMKILSVPGIQAFPGQDPTQLSARYVAYGLGNVGENDDGSAIFLFTKNWKPTRTSGSALNPTDKPFGEKGFVVIHKGGDGNSYKKQDATGKLPDNSLGTVPVASPAFIFEPQGAAPGNAAGAPGGGGVTPDLAPDSPTPALAPEAPAAPAAPAADAPAPSAAQ
ncbi:prepilin-type N-terminal cleavage/methylation domain-containing protein [Verrucomicrobium sp. GAS474]|uniref:type II secretion system protein n=1 Tax=Verrucomicrobium sp. GAS474 TaxID=1882831 RepID=UPI00087CA67A|nr:type II secretion system protein [Verrucomicrobium sp. GAS474]SDT87932.1 prepilin-type N-terminal cleavage/methylation domain-containing protein [Verrucomicrobium sp. GAS474]